jgi:hypothetical protein
VIDADVDGVQQVNRFHPATPDGAAWAVFTLLLSDHVNDDAGAQADVRAILTRHAAPPPAGPVRSVDGIFKHWLDPDNGDTRGTWPDEHATLSTMKIVAAAARAMVYYPDDPEIVRAASRIIFGTRNWDAYLQQSPPTDALSFRGRMIGGPDGTSWARPFHEGIIFAEQAGVYDGAAARASAARWFDRTRWNNDNRTATYLTGYPLTSTASGRFESAFVSLYGALISKPYRNDPSPAGWRAQVRNLRWSSAAWTDDNAARYYTVFSAGTTPTGYNADSLAGGGHPADIATFTSLEALCAFGDTAEAVGAYAAYRKGARETFKGGARLLYRRANDPAQWAFTPNSAGLPDVSLGGVGLAELLSPGSIDAVLAVDYPLVEQCPSDRNADGSIDVEDLYRHLSAPTDLNGDEALTAQDAACLRAWLRRNESGDASTR